MSTIRIADREGGVRLLTLNRPPANIPSDTRSSITTAATGISGRLADQSSAGP